MMDQMIIITLVLISTLSIVNGQLHCFVCTNCPYVEDLDGAVSERCDFVSPPSPPSPPNTPPTATPSPPTASTEPSENATEVYHGAKASPNTNNDLPTPLDLNSDKTTEKPRPLYRNIINQLSGTHQCFRISRNVGDTTEVVRGCVVTANTLHETCVQANRGVAPVSCRICNYDDCNTAKRNTTASIIIILTLVVSMPFLSY